MADRNSIAGAPSNPPPFPQPQYGPPFQQHPHQQLQQQHTTPQQQQQQQQQDSQGRPTAVWTNQNPPLPRGRAPKDPNARTAKFNVRSIQELEESLRHYLDHPPAAPEHSTCEITLLQNASLIVPESDGPQTQANQHSNGPIFNPPTVFEALKPSDSDPRDTMKKQRAVSKVCVAAIQRVDGFKYSFHNNWKSGEENAFRFSYYCNDSLLNKDRVANGKAGSAGRRATKPVYDCKGVLSIKFSATRQCIDVIYKHIPCHDTYEQRAPPPRRDSKRRAQWERDNPDRINSSAPPSTQQTPTQPQFPTQNNTTPLNRNETPVEWNPSWDSAKQPKKKKQKTSHSETGQSRAPGTTAESELRQESMHSLLALIRRDEDGGPPSAAANTTSGTARTNGANGVSPAVPRPAPKPSPAFAPQPVQQASQAQQNFSPYSCEICVHLNARCDRTRPSCHSCSTRAWPCWYKPPENLRPQPSSFPERNKMENEIYGLKRQLDTASKEREQARRAITQAEQSAATAQKAEEKSHKLYEAATKEREQLQQTVKSLQDESAKTQVRFKDDIARWQERCKDLETRSKQLEAQVTQLQEKTFAASQAAAQVATHTTAQLSRQAAPTPYASHPLSVTPASRTQTLPSYSAHAASNPDRGINPAYTPFYGQPAATAHSSRNHMFQPTQPLVPQPRGWPTQPPLLQGYSQAHDNTNLWDSSHMPNNMR